MRGYPMQDGIVQVARMQIQNSSNVAMEVFLHTDLITRVVSPESVLLMSLVAKNIRSNILACNNITVQLDFPWKTTRATFLAKMAAVCKWYNDNSSMKLVARFSDNIYGLPVEMILQQLSACAPALTSWCNTSCFISIEQMPQLQDIVSRATSLTSLRLFELYTRDSEVMSTHHQLLGSALGTSLSLANLDLSRCRLGNNGIKFVAENLTTMISLQQLDVAHNYLETSGVAALVSSLKQKATIVTLNLSSNRISFGPTYSGQAMQETFLNQEKLNTLAGDFGSCSALTKLSLTRNSIHDFGAMRLASVLQRCSSLQHLNLSSNYLFKRLLTRSNEPGAMLLMHVIGMLCAGSLTHLFLNHNNLSINWGGLEQLERQGQSVVVEDYCPLHVMLRNLQYKPEGAHLKQLHLRGNELGDSDIAVLMRNMQYCTRITHLDISSNDFQDGGFTALSIELPNMPMLRELDLSENLLCRRACHAVSAENQTWTMAREFLPSLAQCTSLRTLKLRRCLRHETLMDIFSEHFSTLTTLTVLDLSGNHSHLPAVRRIASVLTRPALPSLRKLDLYVDYEYAHSKHIARLLREQWPAMSTLECLTFLSDGIVGKWRKNSL